MLNQSESDKPFEFIGETFNRKSEGKKIIVLHKQSLLCNPIKDDFWTLILFVNCNRIVLQKKKQTNFDPS